MARKSSPPVPCHSHDPRLIVARLADTPYNLAARVSPTAIDLEYGDTGEIERWEVAEGHSLGECGNYHIRINGQDYIGIRRISRARRAR